MLGGLAFWFSHRVNWKGSVGLKESLLLEEGFGAVRLAFLRLCVSAGELWVLQLPISMNWRAGLVYILGYSGPAD